MRTTRLGVAAGLVLLTSALAQAQDLDVSDLVIEASVPHPASNLVEFGFDSLWAPENGVLLRVNPADNSVIEIALPGDPGRYRGAAVGEGAVWIPDVVNDTILKIDPASNTIVSEITVDMESRDGTIGVGEGSVWVTAQGEGKAWLARYSAATGVEQARIPLPPSGAGVLVDFGSVWVTGTYKNVVYRIDAATNALVATIKVSGSPRFLTSGFGAIWVVNERGGAVQRIDPATNEVVATIETAVDGRFGDITSGGGYVWAAFQTAPLVQIDPATNTIVRIFRGAGLGLAVRYGAGSLWICGLEISRVKVPG